jgi:hypothetical protein
MHELREVTISARPQDEVPVVRHEDVGEQFEPDAGHALGQHLLEGPVIPVRLEAPDPCIGSVEDMEHQPTWREPPASRHVLLLRQQVRHAPTVDVAKKCT